MDPAAFLSYEKARIGWEACLIGDVCGRSFSHTPTLAAAAMTFFPFLSVSSVFLPAYRASYRNGTFNQTARIIVADHIYRVSLCCIHIQQVVLPVSSPNYGPLLLFRAFLDQTQLFSVVY